MIRDGDRTRERILQAIAAAPGIHKMGLCRALGLSWGNVSYHLRVLRGMGLVQDIAHGRDVCWFPAGVPPRQMQWFALLRDDGARTIVDHLARNPGQRVPDLKGGLGMSRRLIRRHLELLAEAGIVRPEGAVMTRFHVERDADLDVVRAFPRDGLAEGRPNPPRKPG